MHGVVAVERRRRLLVRGVPHQRERKALVLRDGEVGHRPHVLPHGLDPVPQRHRVRARGEAGQPVVRRDPGDHLAVVEAHRQLHVHLDGAADALDGAHQMRMTLPHRHAVGDAHRPGRGVVLGLDHERVRAVPAPGGEDCRGTSGGGDLPEPVILVAQQPGEARGRVEVRQAQPVDGAVDAHQGGRVEVSDDGVILDALAHGLILAGSARDAGPGADGGVALLRLLDTGRGPRARSGHSPHRGRRWSGRTRHR